MKLSDLGRSLSHRNFRWFFLGQSVSLLGTWMQQTATTWLVYDLTKDSWLLGVTGFAGQFPVLVLGPIAGVVSDRAHRLRIIIVTQILSMLQALMLAGLTLTNRIAIWQLIALSAFLGCINAFDMPTRQAFMTEMVSSREDLANGIALNSSMVNGARLIGPTIAGFLIDLVGAAICFFINGISYIGVIAALLMMKITRRPQTTAHPSLVRGLSEGMWYAATFSPVRSILLLVTLMGLVGLPYVLFMPVFAIDILHGNARTQGFLMGASGVGALVGSLYLASRPTVLGLGRWIAGTAVVFGIALFAFSYSTVLWLSMLSLSVTGFSMMVLIASCNTILQTIVDEHMRGRVMSLYTVAFLGMTPLGSLLAGASARRYGAPFTFRIGSVCCAVGGVVFAWQLPKLRRVIRPIYTQLGILPEVAAGLQSASELVSTPKE